MSKRTKVYVERRLTPDGPEDMTYIELRAGLNPELEGLPFGVDVHDHGEDEANFDTNFPDVLRLRVPSGWANEVADAMAEVARQVRLVARRQ